MTQQGAEFVIIHNVASRAAKLMTNIAGSRHHMQVICLNWCADEIFTKLAGPAAEGAIGVMPWTPPTVDVPGLRSLRAFLASRGQRLEDQGVHYVQGWYTTAALINGIERAATVGKVTGVAVRDQLEESPGVRTGGVTTEPIRFSPDRHQGVTGSHLFVVDEGSWRPRSSPLNP